MAPLTRFVDAVLSVFAPGPKPTMDTDPFKLLLSPTLSMEAEAFLLICWTGARAPGCSLNTLKVMEMVLKKKIPPPGHEFLHIGARDSRNNQNMSFILERTVDLAAQPKKPAAVESNIVDSFLNHPDCVKVLGAILKALHSVPTAIAVAGAAAVKTGTLSVPVATSVVVPLSLASTLLPSSSSVNSEFSLPLTNPTEPPNSIVDKASLTIVNVFDFLSQMSSLQSQKPSQKPSKDASADDRWLAGSNADAPEYTDSYPAKRIFRPRHLNVFHMALLANVVHSQYPLYSLFKRNCYWFALLIFLAAKIIDNILGPNESPEDPEDFQDFEDTEMTDEFFVPFYLYASNLAGHWMGFKVCEVRDIVLGRIVRLFLQQLDLHEAKVLHSF